MAKKHLTPFEEINEQIVKQQEILDQLGETYSKHLEKIWSQETSLENLNRLYEEANEKVEKMEEFQRNNQAALNDYNNALIRAEQISNDLVSVQNDLKSKQEEIAKLQAAIATEMAKTTPNLRDIDDWKDKLKDAKAELANLRVTQTDLTNDLNTEKEIIDVTLEYREKEKEAIEASDKAQQAFNKRQEEGQTILDDFLEARERGTKALRKGAKEVSSGLKDMAESAKKALEPWQKANHEAMLYARSMGMSQKTADAYLNRTLSWASKNEIGILFNKTTDELIKMQGQYSEIVGRNVQLTGTQLKDMMAMEKFIDTDTTMQMANNLENFGMGMSDTADFVHKTMSEANKYGIAASKLTKTVNENIKMAQNYTFKNGLEGLRSMAKKAIELKTDISLINSMLENTSTVEGAITTGAKLQVLGGSYALGSDPLSMMYESLNDVEGMFDRVTDMAKGKVYYNEQTGNFEMGAMDRYMMKQAATAMGVDPSKMIDVAYRQASLGRIEGQARMNQNIAGDQDMIDLIKNVATWNNGQAVVDINGKEKKVSELTSDDKAALEVMSKTDSQTLQDMAISLRSQNEKLEGIQKESLNDQAEMIKGIAEKFDDLLDKTSLMSKLASIMAMSKLTIAGFQMIAGGFTTVNGLLRMAIGAGNFLNGGRPMMGKGGAGGRMMPKGSKMSRLARIGKSHGWKGVGRAVGALGKGAVGGALGAGLLGGAISLGTDIATGEFKKDVGGSVGRAAGTTIGGAIGMFLGGPIGAMIGGVLGSAVVGGIQKWQKKNRGKIRDEIANSLAASNPAMAGLFSGENALQGNYNKRQLNKIKDALSDGKITEGELSGAILRKARANGDLVKMRDSGVNVQVALAGGGDIIENNGYTTAIPTGKSKAFLNSKNTIVGQSHKSGGISVQDSNINVQGGEKVMTVEAVKKYGVVLNAMNEGTNFKIIPLEPMGKISKVSSKHNSEGAYMPHNTMFEIKPLDINLSGTIKLDLNGHQVDITKDLLSNNTFISKLSDAIALNFNTFENSRQNKNKNKRKFAG